MKPKPLIAIFLMPMLLHGFYVETEEGRWERLRIEREIRQLVDFTRLECIWKEVVDENPVIEGVEVRLTKFNQWRFRYFTDSLTLTYFFNGKTGQYHPHGDTALFLRFSVTKKEKINVRNRGGRLWRISETYIDKIEFYESELIDDLIWFTP